VNGKQWLSFQQPNHLVKVECYYWLEIQGTVFSEIGKQGKFNDRIIYIYYILYYIIINIIFVIRLLCALEVVRII